MYMHTVKQKGTAFFFSCLIFAVCECEQKMKEVAHSVHSGLQCSPLAAWWEWTSLIIVCAPVPQEKRRAERAEQQRVRAEKDKERQARREVRPLTYFINYIYLKTTSLKTQKNTEKHVKILEHPNFLHWSNWGQSLSQLS